MWSLLCNCALIQCLWWEWTSTVLPRIVWKTPVWKAEMTHSALEEEELAINHRAWYYLYAKAGWESQRVFHFAISGKKVPRRNIGSLSNLDNLVNFSLEQVAWEACESKEGGSSHLETIVIFIWWINTYETFSLFVSGLLRVNKLGCITRMWCVIEHIVR